MMFPSHLLATLLVAFAWDRVRPLGPRGWLLALAFGVAIDLDHLLQVPRYLAATGFSGLSAASALEYGAGWQGLMHSPWALPVVAAACLLARSPVPLAFWSLHMVQDFVIATRYVRFGSATEWLVVLALAGVVAALFALDHRAATGAGARRPFHAHVGERIGLAAAWTRLAALVR